MIRPLAELLAAYAARRVPSCDAPWAEVMRHEVDSIENDYAALHWAVGCVVATYSGRINPMRVAPVSALFGVLIMLALVFGGHLVFGGTLLVILEVLPYSVIMVILCALVVSGIRTSVGGPGIFRAIGRAFLGRRFRPDDYRQLAGTLVGVLGNATPSSAATRSLALGKSEVAAMVRDASALIESGHFGSEPFDTILRARISAILADQRRCVDVLRTLASALLWFGFVGFLLGLVKVFLFGLSEPMDIFGALMAHALAVPLLAVVLAAGIVGPLANRLGAAIADDASFYEVIRTAFLCRLAGSDPTLAVRTAFGLLPTDLAIDAAGLGAPSSLKPA